MDRQPSGLQIGLACLEGNYVIEPVILFLGSVPEVSAIATGPEAKSHATGDTPASSVSFRWPTWLLLPGAAIVLDMRKDMSDIHLLPVVMNGRDKAELVAPDVKDRKFPDLIG